MAAVAWAPRINPTTGAQLGAIMDQHAVAGWVATSAFVTAGGRTFQQKWQDTMAAYQAAHAARVAGGAAGAAGVSDDESDQITRLVLLLKQLGIYNAALVDHAQFGAGNAATTGDIAGAPGVGGAANNPMSANEIAQIVDHSLKCWFHAGADVCNDFIGAVINYIDAKLTRHPQAGTMPGPTWKLPVLNAALNLRRLQQPPVVGLPAGPLIATAGIAPGEAGAIGIQTDPFTQPAVPAFGGKPKKASKKAKKSAKKATRKSVKKAAKKVAKKPAKKATRKSVKKAAKKGKKATRKH